jgi:hypothetical protein
LVTLIFGLIVGFGVVERGARGAPQLIERFRRLSTDASMARDAESRQGEPPPAPVLIIVGAPRALFDDGSTRRTCDSRRRRVNRVSFGSIPTLAAMSAGIACATPIVSARF